MYTKLQTQLDAVPPVYTPVVRARTGELTPDQGWQMVRGLGRILTAGIVADTSCGGVADSDTKPCLDRPALGVLRRPGLVRGYVRRTGFPKVRVRPAYRI